MSSDTTVAVVTGAAGGLGFAICRALRDSGIRVALVDIAADALAATAGRIGAETDAAAFPCDLTDDAAVRELPARISDVLGPVGILVNNAGVRGSAPLLETSPEQWRRTLEVDLTAPFVLSQAFLPRMIERGDGKIINIASMAGISAFRGRSAYGVAKAGLIMLTRSIAVEYGSAGIRCNAVAPGVVETPLTRAYFESAETTATLRANTPQDRWAQPDEVAAAVGFLAGPESSFVNGATLTVDGGWTAGYAGAEF